MEKVVIDEPDFVAALDTYANLPETKVVLDFVNSSASPSKPL
jgi:hypothetical protein